LLRGRKESAIHAGRKRTIGEPPNEPLCGAAPEELAIQPNALRGWNRGCERKLIRIGKPSAQVDQRQILPIHPECPFASS
jgi:hypothetical protein